MPIVAVAGCVAQQEGSALLKRSNLIDVIVGTQSLKQLPALVRRRPWAADSDEQSAPLIDINAYEDVSFPLGLARRQDPVKAYVTIIEGATSSVRSASSLTREGTNACGRSATSSTKWCAPPARDTARSSCSGRIVNHYQAPDDAACDFAALLEAVHEVPGVERVPVCEPPSSGTFRCGLIEAVRDLPKVCKHFHLPVHSGRHGSSSRCGAGTRARAIWTWSRCFAIWSRASRSPTDMIVGFPARPTLTSPTP
jgi:tRNA-2-methylthio-N6-dimethylallyladenosine synthase